MGACVIPLPMGRQRHLRVASLAAWLLLLLVAACAQKAGGRWDTTLTNEEKVDRIQKLSQNGTLEAVATLAEATQDPVEEARVEAIRGLGRSGRKEALPVLTQLATSELRPVRQSAAWALGELKMKEGIPILEPMLHDPEYAVRSQAVGSLSVIHDTEATQMLVDFVLKEPDTHLRDVAVQVLSDWKDRRAIPLFEQALRSETNEIRGHAAGALGTIGDQSCIPALTGALEDFNPVVRGQAALSMAHLHDVSSVSIIRKKAEAETDGLARATMAWSLGLLGSDRDWAIRELERILLDTAENEFARAQCATALADLKSCGSRPSLTRAMNDRKGVVKQAASRALTNLKC